jgi:hypothetical protein
VFSSRTTSSRWRRDLNRSLVLPADAGVAVIPPAGGDHEEVRVDRRQRAVGVDPEAAPGLDALRRSEPHEQRLEITASRGRQSEYLVETDAAEFIELLEKQDSDVRDARSVSRGTMVWVYNLGGWKLMRAFDSSPEN